MRKVVLNQSLALRLSELQRLAIEELADQREIALGEAARMFINLGIEAMEDRIE
jgi:hypothetical protein